MWMVLLNRTLEGFLVVLHRSRCMNNESGLNLLLQVVL